MQKKFFVVAVLTVLLGCNTVDQSKDATKKLKALIKPNATSMELRIPQRKFEGGQWVLSGKFSIWKVDDVSVDVRTTDSVVSPLLGEIRITATAPDWKGRDDTRTFAKQYDFKEGKWVPIKRRLVSNNDTPSQLVEPKPGSGFAASYDKVYDEAMKVLLRK